MNMGSRAVIRLEVTLTLDEEETRALLALVGYEVNGFLKVFYEQMGSHYLQPHEAGLRKLFESVRQQTPGILDRTNAARKAFSPMPEPGAQDRAGKEGA